MRFKQNLFLLYSLLVSFSLHAMGPRPDAGGGPVGRSVPQHNLTLEEIEDLQGRIAGDFDSHQMKNWLLSVIPLAAACYTYSFFSAADEGIGMFVLGSAFLGFYVGTYIFTEAHRLCCRWVLLDDEGTRKISVCCDKALTDKEALSILKKIKSRVRNQRGGV